MNDMPMIAVDHLIPLSVAPSLLLKFDLGFPGIV